MNTDYRLGDWTIRPLHACIEQGDEVVHLKPKPMAILECLRQAQGEVVTRDQLFESVWPGGVVSDATLTQCIVELRRAFGDSAQTPQVIKTIPKVGFCLIPPVEEISEETAQPEDPGNPGKHWLSKKPGAFGVALVVAGLVLGAWWYQNDVDVSESESIAQDSGITPSIAVLPFVNMSDEPGNEYFADGLSEELQGLLAKIPKLKVSARTSSFAFRNKDMTVAEIARALNVAHLLEGSVRKTGNRIRISVQLIEAKGGFELWSESYDRTLDDLFAVQDDVAAAVVDALKISLMNEPPRLRETSAEVYSMYLQALFFRNQSTGKSRAKAVEKLQEALAVDPNFAPAVDLLAKTFLYQSNAGERSFDAGFELGRKTALEALAIDTNLAGPRATLAYIESYYDWDWQAAGRRVQQLLALGPENALNTNIAAIYYTMIGQLDRSLELQNQTILLDPITGEFRAKKVSTLMSTGRYDEAKHAVQDLLEIHPEHRWAHFLQAEILLLSGDDEGALQVLETWPHFGNNDMGLLAMVLHSLGRVPESLAIIDSILPDGEDLAYTGGVSYQRALYYAWTGERDLAFAHLEQALEARHRRLAYVLAEPLLYSLHDDPRWMALLERIGLLAYWLEVPEQYGGPSRQPAEEYLKSEKQMRSGPFKN